MQKSFSLYCKIVANFLLQLFENMAVDSQAFIYAYLTMIKASQIFSNKKYLLHSTVAKLCASQKNCKFVKRELFFRRVHNSC